MKVKGFHFKPPKNSLHKKYKVMKITGYLTQCCGKIKNEDEVHGIISKPNMFNEISSLKHTKPEESQVHYCTECYTVRVTDVADNMHNKHKFFDRWKNAMEEYRYLFFLSCMNNKTNRITQSEPNNE